MNKKWFLVIAFVVVFAQSFNFVLASNRYSSSPLGVAIRKYKVGNYTGCLQDMQNIVNRDPSNSIAYYYLAMSYAKAGRKDKAIDAYSKVLALRPNAMLANYAQTGKRCLETPDKCKQTDNSSEIDKMVASPYGDGLSNQVRSDINEKRLQMMKDEINTDKDIDSYQFKQFKDYTHQRSDASVDRKIATKSTDALLMSNQKKDESAHKPTNDEIVAALRVLNQAGLNPYAQVPAVQNAVNQSNVAQGYSAPVQTSTQQVNQAVLQGQEAQNAELAQLSAMMNSQSGGNNNNSMMNMIPYMLSQSKNGNGGNSYSPQLIQAMMMNSMMPNLDFSTKDDDK